MPKAGENLLLDTSVIIGGFKHKEAALQVFATAGGLYMPVIAYGELYLGALKSAVPDKKLQQLAEFIQAAALIDVDWRTAQYYAMVRQRLEAKGKPIPENDIWIAAVAMQHRLKLVSSDAHFQWVEGLDLMALTV